jgi:hypothetical protein
MIIVTDNSILYGSTQEKIEKKEKRSIFFWSGVQRVLMKANSIDPIVLLLILLGICLLPMEQMIVYKNLQAMILSLCNLVTKQYSKT